MGYLQSKNIRLYNIKLYIFFLLLTIFHFFLHFRIAVTDDVFQIALIYKILDPSIYKNDFFLNYVYSSKIYPSFFLYILALITILTRNVYITYKIVNFILIFIFITSSYFLARFIFRDNKMAIISVLLFSLSYTFVTPFWSSLSFAALTPRVIVYAFLPVVTLYFLRNINGAKNTKAFFGLGILFGLHGVTVFPLAIVFFISDFYINRSYRRILNYLFIFILGSSPWIVYSLSLITRVPSTGGQEILDDRWGYTILFGPISDFIKLYIKGISFFSFFTFIGFYGMYLRLNDKITKLILSWTIFFIIYSFLIFIIGYTQNLRIVRVLLFLDPTRAIPFSVFFTVLFIPEVIIKLHKEQKKMLLIILLIFIFVGTWTGRILTGISSWPSYDKDTQDIGLWAYQNTDKDALFLVEPSLFRTVSLRSVVADRRLYVLITGLGEEYYVKEAIKRWNDQTTAFKSRDPNILEFTGKKYWADFIIIERKLNMNLSMPLVYRNNKYLIYKLVY